MSADIEMNNQSFRSIIENSPAIMLLTDPASHSIVAANKAAEDFYGWKRSEMESMSINDINLLSTKEIEAEMDKARQDKSNYFRFKHKTASGEMRDVEVYSGKVEIDGKDYLHHIVHDVTEHKHAEESLRASELQKDIILNSTQEMFAFYDPEMKIIWANKASASSMGMHPEELVGKHCYEIWQCKTEPCDDCIVLKAKNTKKPQGGEGVTPDGRHWAIRGYPVFDEQGDVVNLIELGLDITSQKKAEEQAKLSGERLREAEKIGKMGHVDWIVAEQQSYWSDEVFQIYERDPKLGVPAYEEIMNLHQPEDAARLEKAVIDALQQGKDYDLDLVALMPSGKKKYLHVIGRPVKDADGDVTNIKGIVQDITERKQAEVALLEHQELLAAIYRNAPLVLMVVDSERRIQQVNGFATQFAGRDAEEMLGLRGGEALRCMHALDHPKGCGFGEFCQQCVIRNTVLNTLETGETHLQVEAPYHFQKSEKQVQEMTFLTSTTPITVKDKRMVLVTLQDITKRKQAEESLKAKMNELQRFHSLTIGREFAMIELKKEVNELLEKSGQPAKYKIVENPEE